MARRTSSLASYKSDCLRASTKIDALTHCCNEANTEWDKEWTARDTVNNAMPQWKPSLGKTSEEFRLEAQAAPTRAERKNLLDKAKLVATEEEEHMKRTNFLNKASRYADRNRFRCIGTPLLIRDERAKMSLRSRWMLRACRSNNAFDVLWSPVMRVKFFQSLTQIILQ